MLMVGRSVVDILSLFITSLGWFPIALKPSLKHMLSWPAVTPPSLIMPIVLVVVVVRSISKFGLIIAL